MQTSIVPTMDNRGDDESMTTIEGRPRRREYSPEFKAMVLEQIHQLGSVSGVALSHGLHPNMVHRWVHEERERRKLGAGNAFVPLLVQPVVQQVVEDAPCESPTPSAPEEICIEIQRAGGTLIVHWPLSAAQQCAQLLRDWLR
jgi:transposase